MRGFFKARLGSILDGVLLLLIVGSAVSIGAVHPIAAAAAAGVTLLFTLLVMGALKPPLRSPLPLVFWCLLLLGLWSLIQCLPIGRALAFLAGEAAGHWELAGLPVIRLSGNLPATALMALKCSAAAMTFAAGFYYLHRTERVDRLIAIVIGSAAFVTVLALVQSWLRSDTILFFYEPQMVPVRGGLHGSFVNPDHFGAYAAIAAVLSLGRGVMLRVERVRYIYQALFVLLFAGVILSLSLSALAAVAVGCLAFWRSWRRHSTRIGGGILEGVAVLAGVAVCLAGAFIIFGIVGSPKSGIEAQLTTWRGLGEIWSASLGVVASNPLTGVGSGTLTDLLTARLEGPPASIWFARNEIIQAMVDFGVPAAALLFTGLVLTMWPLRLHWHTEDAPTTLPLCAALWSVVAVACLDFALHVPAVGIVGLLLLAAMASLARRYRGRRRERRGGVSGVLRQLNAARAAALGGLVGLTVGAAAWSIASAAAMSRAEGSLNALRHRIPSESVRAETVEAAGRAVLALRPGFGRIYTSTGHTLALLDQWERASDWLSDAALLLPTDPLTSQLLGVTYLESEMADAAVDALARAIALAPDRRGRVVASMVDHTTDVEVWSRVAVDADTRLALFDALLVRDRPFEVLAFADALLNADPRDAIGLEGACRAAYALQMGELASYFSQRLLEVDPDNVSAHLVLSGLESARDEPDQAVARLEGALEAHPDDARLWFALGEVLLARGEQEGVAGHFEEQMMAVRDNLRPLALADDRMALEYHALSARFFLLTGQWRAAASSARLGLQTAPDRAYFHLVLGRALAELHDPEGAQESLQQAWQLDPSLRPAESGTAAPDFPGGVAPNLAPNFPIVEEQHD